MKRIAFLAPLFVLSALTLSANAATTTVTLSEVHICCGKCVTGVNNAVKPFTGVTAVCDQAAKTVVLTAPDKEAEQKAVNALVAAGYFGKSSDPAIKLDAVTGAPEGKVTSLEVSGVHLCCNSCVTAVNAIVAKIPGITASSVKANATSITLAGNFEPKVFFDELQKAGLTGKVAAPAAAPK